jgi:hypothetical protein
VKPIRSAAGCRLKMDPCRRGEAGDVRFRLGSEREDGAPFLDCLAPKRHGIAHPRAFRASRIRALNTRPAVLSSTPPAPGASYAPASQPSALTRSTRLSWTPFLLPVTGYGVSRPSDTAPGLPPAELGG